jgi:hypothetical protein
MVAMITTGALAAANLHVDWQYIASGLPYALEHYGLALPLIGLGLATPPSRAGLAIACVIAFAVGVGASLSLGDWVMTTQAEIASLMVRGPVCNAVMCGAVGLALALPRLMQGWHVPIAALLSGAALGMLIALDSPGDDASIWFSDSAAAGGLLLVVLSMALRSILERPWIRVAGRILGSWLIAVGLMLTGLSLAPRPTVEVSPDYAVPLPEVDLSRQP